MDEAIIEVLNYLGDKFNMAVDWTGSNVLPYVKELADKFVKWEIKTSVAWIVIAAVIAILSWIPCIVFARMDEEECAVIVGTLAGCVAIVAIIVVCVQVFDIIECNTFPEKALYEYITDYIDTSK